MKKFFLIFILTSIPWAKATLLQIYSTAESDPQIPLSCIDSIKIATNSVSIYSNGYTDSRNLDSIEIVNGPFTIPLDTPSRCLNGQFLDSRDGQLYKCVKIGSQTWMAQNLNYQGSPFKIGRCYDDNPVNCDKFGRLYTRREQFRYRNDICGTSAPLPNLEDLTLRGICPKGWHLPSESEWDTLLLNAVGDVVKFKSKTAWTTNGTDDFGFSVLPVGAQFFKDSIIYYNCYGGCHTPYYVVPGVTAKFFAGMGMSVSFNIRPLFKFSYGLYFQLSSYEYITFTDTSWVKEMYSTRKTNAGSIRCIQD